MRKVISKVSSKLNFVKESIEFLILRKVLKRYKVEFLFRDRMGIITKTNYKDNFQYTFKNRTTCDATPLMEALDEKLHGNIVAIDVGANIGITTVWMARKCKNVYAFEPETINYNNALETLKLNNSFNVELIQKAISDEETILDLNICEGYGHHSLGVVSTSKIIGKSKVQTTTLDNFCKKREINFIDFLKIDVEGFELEVLRGAKQLLKQKKIKLIAFELSKVPLQSLGKKEEDILEFLKEHHYQIKHPNGSIFELSNLRNYIHMDLIAELEE